MKRYNAYDVMLRQLKAERWRWQDEHVEAHRLLETTSIPLVPEPAAPIVGREGGRVQALSPTSRLMAERWRWQDEHVGAHRLSEITSISAAPIVGRESARVQALSPTTRAEDGGKPLKRVLEELAKRHGFAGRDLAHDRVEPHVEGRIDRMQIKSPVNPAERPAHAGRMLARARAALATLRRAMTTRRRQLFGCLR
jgi:hypothetical protein